MLRNAVRICEAKFGNMWVREGDKFRIVAIHGRATGISRLRCSAIRWFSRSAMRHGPPSPAPARSCRSTTSRRHRLTACGSRIATVELAEGPHPGCGADAQGKRAGRHHRHLSPGGSPIHRQADRAGREFRRPGRDRHREHAAAQRIAPAHRRSQRSRWRSCGPRRIAWCRPKNSPRSAN